MRQFYKVFSGEKVLPMETQLSWSHYSELLTIKDINEILYYVNISINQNLSKKALREKIKNKEYYRLDNKTKEKITKKEDTSVEDFVKNPILVKNKYNYINISEKILKQ